MAFGSAQLFEAHGCVGYKINVLTACNSNPSANVDTDEHSLTSKYFNLGPLDLRAMNGLQRVLTCHSPC